ncbi:MAG: 50S ribosomal protein L10 [Verrucomicrobiota bacterium]|nr:50S ribosomal protein L10 [Verrucomicrobiota bacterium]
MRAEKAIIVETLKTRLNASPYLIVTEYQGLKVDQFNELRKRLRGVQAEYKVIKNSALTIAARELGLPDMKEAVAGQMAIVTGAKDISAAAKILKTFASEFEKPKIKLGILDHVLLDAAQIKAIADLPSREVLQSKFLGLLLAPSTQLVRLLNTPATQIAQVIKAHSEKQQGAE